MLEEFFCRPVSAAQCEDFQVSSQGIKEDLGGISSLPVEQVVSPLKKALARRMAAVLVAPPGSGKTTRIPLALLQESWLAGRKIIMLEPRRLAARLAATYMAGLMGEEVGESVGYQVRFDRKISSETRIEVITEGLLTRRLQQDPELADVGLIIFDEFHERSLDADLALALSIDTQGALRDDLRLLVMSATMDAVPVSTLLNNAPVIEGQGQLYPVEMKHIPPLPRFDSPRPDHLARSVVRAIGQILDHERGDMLVFLPGVGEIKRVEAQLGKRADCVICPLHGTMNSKAQQRAILPDVQGRQRIILSTTIAETSVTIEGITVVLDSGWKRVPLYHQSTGLSGLSTVRVSRASARQRAGRAGRLAPGICYRLWHAGVEAGLQEFDKPEILQADLTPLVLELANWGVTSPGELAWLDTPPQAAVEQGKTILQDLGALDSKKMITTLGREISGFPLHPRLAAMVMKSGRKNSSLAVDLAALLSERDIISGAETADLEKRLFCLDRFRRQGKSSAQAMGGNIAACAAVDRVSRQLKKKVHQKHQQAGKVLSPGGVLALAYPDRIARQRNEGGRSYRLRSGKGAALTQHDPLFFARWLVVASQHAGRRDGRIFLALSISEEEVKALFAKQLERVDEVRWDSAAKGVVSRRCVRLGTLSVAEQRISRPDVHAVQQALLEGIYELGMDVLPWTGDARQLQARMCCLREWQPEKKWPDVSDASLLATMDEWLLPFLGTIRNLKGCSNLNLRKILLSRLDYSYQQALDRHAPTHIRVPSGTRAKLEYGPGKPPVLAVRLQEMFGQEETPAVCQGRVQVLLHLLSPARRPVQITQDLKGFWQTSYFEVRKELKGRYPKHHWPQEPWAAMATARVKKGKKKRG